MECIVKHCKEESCEEGTFIRKTLVCFCHEHYIEFCRICCKLSSIMPIDVEYQMCVIIQSSHAHDLLNKLEEMIRKG